MIISQTMLKDYKKLFSLIKGHEALFAVALIFMFLSSVFEGFQITFIIPILDRVFTNKAIILPDHAPAFVQAAVDMLNAVEPKKLFWWVTMLILPMLLVKHVVFFIAKYLMTKISQKVMRDVRTRLFAKIQHLSLDYFSQKRTGELVSRITNDVLMIENAVSYGITDLFRVPFLILFYMGVAFTIHFKAALVIFILMPAIALPVRMVGKRLRKIAQGFQEKMADINSHLLETISGNKVVKSFCMEDKEIQRFDKQSDEIYRLNLKASKRILTVNPITELFGGACCVIIIVFFGQQVLAGELSFGVFTTFIASIMLIISPVKKMGNVHAIMQRALSANERIHEVLNANVSVKQSKEAKDLAPIKDSIVFDHISFAYDQESGEVLKDIDLTIKAGELVAIVGPTGTGKSTLVNLIPRFYDVNKGAVLIDGQNVKDLTFDSLRQQVGMVTQETFLFNDTVRNNIAYGKSKFSQEELLKASEQAFAHNFIQNLPQGYDTIVGDRGVRLSGGEKQRLTIARAILKNPPILILDEATSQLDSESEKYVQQALDDLMENRTVIAIAHRLSTILKADKIVVLNKGGVVGCDTHENLLKTCDLYQRLYHTQFSE